jgi:hypothetical protein
LSGIELPLLLLLLGLAVWCLVVSGFRAYQAVVKPIDWPRPYDANEIVRRASTPPDQGGDLVDELTALLVAEQRGTLLAAWKSERSRQEGRFFALALIALLVAALFILLA